LSAVGDCLTLTHCLYF